MNPATLVGSIIWFFVWAAAAFMQGLTVYTVYYTFAVAREPILLPIILVCGFVALLLTAGASGLNGIPSLFWRFRKTVNARIVVVESSEHGRRYGVKMQFCGGWLWVSAPERNGFVRAVWHEELCPGKYLSDRRADAEHTLANLGHFLSQSFSSSSVADSVQRVTFERGILRKD